MATGTSKISIDFDRAQYLNANTVGTTTAVASRIPLSHDFNRPFSAIPCSITDRRSAAGRAPDAVSNDEDRDARPVRCNGWLVVTPGRRECIERPFDNVAPFGGEVSLRTEKDNFTVEHHQNLFAQRFDV